MSAWCRYFRPVRRVVLCGWVLAYVVSRLHAELPCGWSPCG